MTPGSHASRCTAVLCCGRSRSAIAGGAIARVRGRLRPARPSRVCHVQLRSRVTAPPGATAETDQQRPRRLPRPETGPAIYDRARLRRKASAGSQDRPDLSADRRALARADLVPSPHSPRERRGQGDRLARRQGASAPARPVRRQTPRNCPDRPATVADALPLVPGVVREPGGGLSISGSAEHRSALIVNSADVTDPATGQFGLTVPIDSVETLNVYQTPFLAEYGRFTAGLVSVETRRGGDKWKWELNDPLPEFRIRSWHLRGLKRRHSAAEFRRPADVPASSTSPRASSTKSARPRSTRCPFPTIRRQQEGVNSFAPARLGGLRPAPGHRHRSRRAAAPGLRQYGLLQPAAHHARRPHPQLHRHARRPPDASAAACSKPPFPSPASMPRLGAGHRRT